MAFGESPREAGARDQRNRDFEEKRAADDLVRKNIKTQLDQGTINREQANALAKNAGLPVFAESAPDDVWRGQWNEGGVTEEIVMHELTTEAQRREEKTPEP